MAWFSRVSRFGDVHLCYAQEAENSCGIASVMMAAFKLKKFSVQQAIYAEKAVYKKYGVVTGASYDGSKYSDAIFLAKVLSGLGVGTWKAEYVGQAGVAQVVVDSVGSDRFGASLLAGPLAPAVWLANQMRTRNPVILLVGWGKGGAHFVVVDTVNAVGSKLFASVCDPWDGNVHVTEFSLGSPFTYRGTKVPFSFDLGGKKHEYSSPSTGVPNGWVIRKIT